ncbi:uncharacterized protein with von Willebrand factor type A (vWA) domain [Bradyrhizobium sp. GM0.4]
MSAEPELPRAARVFISFVGLLRTNGFAVAPEQTTSFLAAIQLLGPRSLEDIRQAALATLAPPPERRATFDRLFDLHFRGNEAIDRVNDGEDDETVRLQEEARGNDEPLLSDRGQRVRSRSCARRSPGRAPLCAALDHRCAAPAVPRGAEAPAEAARPSPHAGSQRTLRGFAPHPARLRSQRWRNPPAGTFEAAATPAQGVASD